MLLRSGRSRKWAKNVLIGRELALDYVAAQRHLQVYQRNNDCLKTMHYLRIQFFDSEF